MPIHRPKLPFLLLLVLIFSPLQDLYSQLPEQDCINAVPVCSPIIIQPNSYVGEGSLPNEINSLISCLRSGEENSVWYKVSIVDSGLLSFIITPNYPLDDYDWSVYNLTNASCSAIASDVTLEVSCNYSANFGVTGANLPGGSTSNGAAGPNRNAPIPVLAGETYVVHVSNFSSAAFGFTLDFTASTAMLGTGSIPTLDTVERVGNTDTLLLRFNNEVSCNSFSSSNLEILVDTNVQVIDSIWSPTCFLANQVSQDFKFLLANRLPPNTQLTLNLIDTVFTACGTFNTSGSIQNYISPIFQIESSSDTICEGDSVVLSTPLPDSGYAFLWLPSRDTSSTLTVTPLSSQNYSLRVRELSSNLSQTDTIRITVNQAPRINLGGDFFFCEDSISLSVPAGLWSAYQWEDGSTDSLRWISGPGDFALEVLDQVGCAGMDSISIERDSLPASSFNWIVDTLSVTFADSISNADTLLWEFGDGNFSTDRNPTHTYDSVGTYIVSLIASNRCGNDTLTQEVEVKGWPASISEKILDHFLKIQPNPGSDQITLQFLHSSFQGEIIQLYDMQGRLIRDYAKIQGNRLRISREKLESGIYFIRIGNMSRKLWFE